MEGIADIGDESTLLGDEVELGVDVAVDTLTGLTTDGDDGGIGSAHLIVDGDGRDTDFRIFLLAEILSLIPLGWMALGLELHFGKLDVFAVDIREDGRRFDACVLETLEHVDHVRGMYATRTGATREEVVGVLSEEGDGLDFIDH